MHDVWVFVLWQDVPMLSDQLDEAINHIKTLQEDLEKMKERKKSLMGMDEINKIMNMGTAIGLQPTRIEIQDLGSTMVVLLISGLDNQLIFYKSICVLEEEGAEVVNASYYIMDDKVFHTIHCKVNYLLCLLILCHFFSYCICEISIRGVLKLKFVCVFFFPYFLF